MQNKANFKKVKFNVNKDMKKDYEQMDTWSIMKNEPKTNPIKAKTNPIKANLQNAKMNVTKEITKDYGIIVNWAIYPKQTQNKPKQTQSCPLQADSNPTCRGVASGEDGSKPM